MSDGVIGLEIVDVRDSLNLVSVYSDLNLEFSDLAVGSGYLYLAMGSEGVEIYDVSIPATPNLHDTLDLGTDAITIHVENNTAYLVDAVWGVSLYGLEVPGQPALLGSHDLSEQGAKVRTTGSHALVSDELTGKLQVVARGRPSFEAEVMRVTPGTTVEYTMDWGGTAVDAALLVEHSPLTYAGNVETPVLLLHGEDDVRCPIGQSEEYLVALKRLGKEVEMVRFPGSSHGFVKSGPPKMREEYLVRTLAWFDEHLGDGG